MTPYQQWNAKELKIILILKASHPNTIYQAEAENLPSFKKLSLPSNCWERRREATAKMRRDSGTLGDEHKMVKQAPGSWLMAHGTVQHYFAMLPRHQYDGMTIDQANSCMGQNNSVSVWQFMTGLFEIWRFSCISKRALINSHVGRNVSWDYLVRGVFLPAGLPYRLSCVYRCLQAHCNTAEQDNSCWIFDCAVKFSQNSEITLNGSFNILGEVRLWDSWVRHNITSFPAYLESK